MHGAALESVVEILAVRRGAVDESGAGAAQRAGVADRRARAVVVKARKRGLDIILVARGDAKPGDVDQQILAFGAHSGRQLAGVERNDARGQLLGDGDFRQYPRRIRFNADRHVDGAHYAPRSVLASATTVEVSISMNRPSTEMAARSPLSLRS